MLRASGVILKQGDCRGLIGKMDDETVDLTITSPPYFIGKPYDISASIEDFENIHREILPQIARVTKYGGSICWQVGYHTKNNITYPLDYIVHSIMSGIEGIYLRNRIIWKYGHGLHASRRFSARHEVILWYSKGKSYTFNLDAVRVPQRYPGKKAFKGPRQGQFTSNPLGKNPEDVWEIPNIRAGHIEKTAHPCQFPVALPARLIRALTQPSGMVFDPFMGAGSTGVAAILEGRRFLGFELDREYFSIARSRCKRALNKQLPVRADVPVQEPNPRHSVAQRPAPFVFSGEPQMLDPPVE